MGSESTCGFPHVTAFPLKALLFFLPICMGFLLTTFFFSRNGVINLFHKYKVKGPVPLFITQVCKIEWTALHSGSTVTREFLFTYDQSQPTGPKSPWPRRQHVYVWKAVYVGQSVRCLKGWEIMLTKGAPGALDWVSLLPFLPLSPLPSRSPLLL